MTGGGIERGWERGCCSLVGGMECSVNSMLKKMLKMTTKEHGTWYSIDGIEYQYIISCGLL